MNFKHQIIKTSLAWGGLLAFMTLFRPDTVPVAALIVPFVLIYVAFYSLWRLFGMLRQRFLPKDGEWKPHRRLGMVLSGSAVLLVVLQSLGQLTLRDVITVLAILSLGYLYLGRSHFVLPKN